MTKFINLWIGDIIVVTAKQYEEIQRNITARALIGDTEIGDGILATLLHNTVQRYSDIKDEKK